MMTFIVFLAAAFILLMLVLQRARKNRPDSSRLSRERSHPSASPARSAAPAADAPSSGPERAVAGGPEGRAPLAPDTRPVPAELGAFKPADRGAMDPELRRALSERLEKIPRPPRSFHRLVSPSFLSTATSEEFAELVMGEPLIAAKVLARVNSPLYGLQKPVVQVGQAITFLGLNNVRAICIQYMLDDAFKADSPELQKIFDDIWNASAIASDLCFRLAQKLGLPNPRVVATRVVLSYVGHLAAAALLPREVAVSIAAAGMLERSRTEQRQLGVPAGELTRLLMEAWELPAELIEGVAAVDRVLMTPCDDIGDAGMAEDAGLCYFSARAGEMLVRGALKPPLDIRGWEAWGADFFHLAHYMELPRLAQLPDAVRARDLNGALETMLAGLAGQGRRAGA